MMNFLRKAWCRHQIRNCKWDQEYWRSAIRVATQNELVARGNLEKSIKRESALRNAILNLDFKLPRILRPKGWT